MLASLAVLIAGGSALLVTDTPLWGLWLTITVFMASRVVILGQRLRGRAWERTGAT
jgi:Na+-driven multidrug efflux pump